MDLVDKLIEEPGTQDDAFFKIRDVAVQKHGPDYVKSIIDLSSDEDDAFRRMMNAARAEPTLTESLEGKPMIDVPGLRDLTTPDQWYGGLENLTALAKPAAFMTTPITEAVRAPFKYVAENFGENTSQTPPVNTAAEYESVLPSDRAGLGLLLRDAANAFGIQTQPMADVQSAKYPKLAQFMKQMTDPTNVGGAILDVAVGSKLPSPKLVSGGASALEDINSLRGVDPNAKITMSDLTGRVDKVVTPGLRQAVMTNELPALSLEGAADYVRAISKDKQKLAELERTGKIYDIAKMVQEQPDKYLHQFQPNKIYENIMGDLLPDEATRIGKSGELSRMNQFQENLIENIPAENYVVPREELRLSTLDQLGRQQLEAGQMSSAENIINRNIPVTQPDPSKLAQYRAQPGYGDFSGAPPAPFDPSMPNIDSYMDYISRLNEEPIGYASNMRKLGNKLREPVIPGEVSTDIAARNAAGRALEQAARNAQDQAMGFMDPADMIIYDQQNAKISNLLNLRDLTQANLQSPTTNAPTPWMPSTWARGINRYVKPLGQEIGSAGINQLSGQMDVGAMSPGAAGVNLGAGEFLANKSGVNNFKIPRTSDEVFANQDLVRAKIEREFGPQVSQQMDAISSSEDFTNFMATLANMNPMAFTPDPYNRFNGVIKEPILKGKALEDTVKNKNMDVLDKANAVEELMLNNRFHGVPQE